MATVAHPGGGKGRHAAGPRPGRDPAVVADTSIEVVRRMLSSSGELVTMLEGANAPAGPARAVQDHLADTRPDIEVVLYEGGQGGYPLLIGVE